jgi:hypothetical protein
LRKIGVKDTNYEIMITGDSYVIRAIPPVKLIEMGFDGKGLRR